MEHRFRISLAFPLLACLTAFGADKPANPALPSVFIAGDSTAADGVPDAIGWGKPFPKFFDAAKINIVNQARGGRSSRTFVTEGLWGSLLADVKSGDYVIIQFGHNDGAERNDDRIARGSLPGLGDETEEIDNKVTGQHETVHTFGWYMRKMIAETKAKGATPILFSLTVRNIWKDAHVERGSGNYGEWTRELAQKENTPFIDLTALVADRYDRMGADTVKPLFPKDHTHTSEAGAELNARFVVAGLKATRENAIIRTLSPEGRAIEIAPFTAVALPLLARPSGTAERENFMRWLNLPDPADPALPNLFLIGDSTVRNGRGDGIDQPGQWGWGDPLTAYFDPLKINVVNRAVGGTGARTFITQGYWDRVLALLKPGDIVIMQFGHNDNGPRGALKGVGEETEDRDGPGGTRDTVHTFGWYLRKYVADTRAKGATPILCTLIPRNTWENGRIARPADTHDSWARTVAADQKVPLLDLYDLIARRYDPLGETAVTALFADKRVHTTRAGAELNAEVVVSALRKLPQNPTAPYLRSTPAVVW